MRASLAVAAATILAVGVVIVLHRAGGDGPPSVLLVTLDTLRADRLGAYGYPADTSPNLDAFARNAVVYERAVAASSRTAPSHASIFTSRWVRGHSVGHRNGSTALHAHATLASILRDAGFETAAFVSNTMLRKRIGLNHGFTVYDDELPDVELRRTMYERVAEATTRRALEWIDRGHEGPIFVWVHYNDPHGPYAAPSPAKQTLPGPVPPGDQPLPALTVNRGWQGIPDYQVLPGLSRPSEYLGRYAAEVRYMDEWLGRLLEGFRSATPAKGRIILLTADHGESFGEEGYWFCHGYATTPDLVHVPFILSAPGLEPGRSPELVHHVDVGPTILELLDLPVPEDAEGIGLASHWRERRPLPERLLFSDVGEEISAYSGDSFLRVRLGSDLGSMKASSSRLYHWGADGGWNVRTGTDPERLRAVEAYAENRVSLRKAPTLSRADAERLRTLGYVDVERE